MHTDPAGCQPSVGDAYLSVIGGGLADKGRWRYCRLAGDWVAN